MGLVRNALLLLLATLLSLISYAGACTRKIYIACKKPAPCGEMARFDPTRLFLLLTLICVLIAGASCCKKNISCTGRAPCRRLWRRKWRHGVSETDEIKSDTYHPLRNIEHIDQTCFPFSMAYINEFLLVFLHIAVCMVEVYQGKCLREQIKSGDGNYPGVKIIIKKKQQRS
ncbi:unnamed protein product, partial [Iphiclides podalirius]